MPVIEGEQLRTALLAGCRVIENHKDRLCAIDGETGDGDHGISMTIGARAIARALKSLPAKPSPGEVFQAASDAFADDVGATIGPIYESAFAAAAGVAAQQNSLDSCRIWVDILHAMGDAISQAGGAKRGDKTLLDALLPAADYLASASNRQDLSIHTALLEAGSTALAAAEATRDMVASKGRASRLGARSAGHPDAGATSFALLLDAMARSLAGKATG
ncbi:MAG: hypothetical protein RIQ52_2079 [Pseudomonadota bacterium]|jgi:dihydroxyacetone kinase phosphoprotein-dependent L subunit